MLSIKTRKKYLKNLGFYNGKIDNKNTADYRKAVLNLQKKYFPKSEQDGRYGNNTEILLRNAERIRIYCKNFKLEEFSCECGGKYCTKFPSLISIRLLKNLQKTRNKLGVPMTITSGIRCQRWNTICGGATFSRHMTGQAIDFVSDKTKTFTQRKKLIDWYIKLYGSNYAYQYKYGRTKYRKYTGSNPNCNYPEMGNAIHIDVK